MKQELVYGPYQRREGADGYTLVSDPLEVIQRSEPGRLCLAANLREQQKLCKQITKYQHECSDSVWRVTNDERPMHRRLNVINRRLAGIHAERMKQLAAHDKRYKQMTRFGEGDLKPSTLTEAHVIATRLELLQADVEHLKSLIRAQRQRMYSTRTSVPSLSISRDRAPAGVHHYDGRWGHRVTAVSTNGAHRTRTPHNAPVTSAAAEKRERRSRSVAPPGGDHKTKLVDPGFRQRNMHSGTSRRPFTAPKLR